MATTKKKNQQNNIPETKVAEVTKAEAPASKVDMNATTSSASGFNSPYKAPKATTPNAPTYTSPYGKVADNALQKILNREDFQYNPQSDAMYKYYADNYTKLGQQAMADTVGNAALLTGGYGNSYGVTAGQQAYNNYMQDLANIVPQLEQQAYDRYRADTDALYNQYQTIMNAENYAYGKYRDDVTDYVNDRTFAYNQQQDQIAQKNWQAQFNRQNYESDRAYAYNQQQDQIAQKNWQAQYDRANLESDRAYNRDVLESDRNYNRSVLESDRAYNRNVLEYDKEFKMAVDKAKAEANKTEDFDPKEAYDFIDKYGGLIKSDAEYVESLFQSFAHQDGFFEWAARQQLPDGTLMSDLLIEMDPSLRDTFDKLYGSQAKTSKDYSYIPDTSAASAMASIENRKRALKK